jgi:RNA polymerase-binding transcription factor DksA
MEFAKQQKTLLEEKDRLVKQLAYYKAEDPYLAKGRSLQSATDDDISETEGHDRLTATRLALKQDLLAVERALAKIDSGDYGVCEVCGQKIEPARLEVMPAASLCLADESKKKH